jgi:hypothetical protein
MTILKTIGDGKHTAMLDLVECRNQRTIWSGVDAFVANGNFVVQYSHEKV